ncbi:hypothetical protein ACLQ2S_02545 [Micromonospora sp. DT48]|uniref:hypothetical protein n=1 Tax=unclassified Micromonospora TaxID=2617518 RepID=UPI0012BCAF94|nr:hypothetical protein [Micromonospora sp. CP22]MTK00540.1 hypothetical protein [Micromonospora sp. CP22]
MFVDAEHRLRGVLLAAVGVAALALGGWWWQTQTPEASSDGSAAPGGSSAVVQWRDYQEPGELVREAPAASAHMLIDERTGAVVRLHDEPMEPAGSTRPRSDLVWTEQARLPAGGGVVRQARMGPGERHLLRLRCTGPGELLVAVAGARSAAPITVACDGGLVTMEITGSGGPARLSFSPAGSESVEVEARLIALR